jgi:Sugar (and other) transporter
MALACVYIFAVIYQFGWGPVPWIYIAEIPTVRLRSLNVAIGASAQWLFNFVVARSVPSMLATLGLDGYGTYLLFGAFSLLMFVFTWFFVPETKGMFLEEMDDMFGVLELAKRMLEEAELENGVPPDKDSRGGSRRPSFMPQRSSKGQSPDVSNKARLMAGI